MHPFEERFGWFCVREAYIISFAEELRAGIEQIVLSLEEKKQKLLSNETLHFTRILKNETGALLGFISSDFSLSKSFGSHGGFFLMLHPTIQKKGLSAGLYKMMLEELRLLKIRVFTGGTSQPGVMKLGKQMGRRGVVLVYGPKKYFDASHFFGH